MPGATLRLHGTEFSRADLWQTGVAIGVIANGALSLALGTALFVRKRWACPVVVAFPLLQLLPVLVVFSIQGRSMPLVSPEVYAVFSLVWAVEIALYLWASVRARQFFESDANAVSS